jgi:transposase
MPAYLRLGQSRGVVRRVPETPGVPDPDAGVRAANARLRELLMERDTRIAEQDAEIDNNEAERTIRMSKLRIKISGCMRAMTGAEEFCAIRAYLATAARHGISALDALTRAFEASPWTPETG